MILFNVLFFLLSLTMIDLISFNVNGLRNVAKLESILTMCDAPILCLQETHWDSVWEQRCRALWPKFSFLSSYGLCNSRGVCVIVRDGFNIDATHVEQDNNGRWIKIQFSYNNVHYNLLNIYAPNIEGDRTGFFSTLKNIGKDCDIIMGDFNVKLSVLDVAENVVLKQDTSRAALQTFMHRYDFCDLWRVLHPTVREFSRIQLHQNSLRQSRIDLCLVKKSLLFLFGKMSHNLTFMSDHVFLRVGMGIQKRGKGGGVCGISMHNYF